MVSCPECTSNRIYKDGLRYLPTGPKQRYLCRDCGYRFSEKSYKQRRTNGNHQLCVILKEAKKLDSATKTKIVAGKKQVSVEAQIVKYLISLKNDGRKESTVKSRDWQLRRLLSLGADLNNPESVKKAIASLEKTESYKLLLCVAYEGFAKANGLSWTRPKYKQNEHFPFVPHESELDALISDCGKKSATLLRLEKETAMRLGEAWLVEWTDFDAKNRTIVCRNPEKRSRPRVFNDLTPDLCKMLQDMPHNSQYIFTCSRTLLDYEDPRTHKARIKRAQSLLVRQRRRTANKLKNPRILKISHHTCRHWKATSLYHKTKDILYVMKFLGHRSIKNTLVYIDLEKLCHPHAGEDYTGKVAKTQTEKLQLIEAGFEFVSSDPDGTQYFRRRK